MTHAEEAARSISLGLDQAYYLSKELTLLSSCTLGWSHTVISNIRSLKSHDARANRQKSDSTLVRGLSLPVLVLLLLYH